MADYSQDLVLALLDLLAPEPPPQGPLASLGPANLRGALRELATRVMGYPDEGEARLLARLWEGCNPAEVLLHLKVRPMLWGWLEVIGVIHPCDCDSMDSMCACVFDVNRCGWPRRPAPPTRSDSSSWRGSCSRRWARRCWSLPPYI